MFRMIQAGGMGILGVLLMMISFVLKLVHRLTFANRVLVWIRLYAHRSLVKNTYRLNHVLNTSFQTCMLQIS